MFVSHDIYAKTSSYIYNEIPGHQGMWTHCVQWHPRQDTQLYLTARYVDTLCDIKLAARRPTLLTTKYHVFWVYTHLEWRNLHISTPNCISSEIPCHQSMYLFCVSYHPHQDPPQVHQRKDPTALMYNIDTLCVHHLTSAPRSQP